MAQMTKAQRTKAAKAKKARDAKKAKAKAPAKPQMTDAQRKAKADERTKKAEQHKGEQAKTRVSRRDARNLVYTAALRRFWALIKDGKPFQYGDMGVKCGATPSVAKEAGGVELSAGDWRNIGLRCHRHYLLEGAVEQIAGAKPHQFRVIAGSNPATKPVKRTRKSAGTGKKAKAAGKTRATPSASQAKEKAAKAKAARDKAKAAREAK